MLPGGVEPIHSPGASIPWLAIGFYPARKLLFRTSCFRGTRLESHVLCPTGDHRDETSIRRGYLGRPLHVIVLRFRQPGPEAGRGVPGGAKRDRAPRRLA